MKKNISIDYKNELLQLISDSLSSEIATLFQNKYGEGYDPFNDVELIIQNLYYIISFALLNPLEKGFGSISNGIDGDPAVRGLKEISLLPTHRYDLTKYKKFNSRYTLFLQHETSFIAVDHPNKEKTFIPPDFYTKNFPAVPLHNRQIEPLMSKLMYLNKKYFNIRNEILEYNNSIRNLKANLVALNKDKAFVFTAFNIFSFLPNNDKENTYINLIKRCFDFIQNKSIKGQIIRIDEKRQKFILKNLPTDFIKCEFENFCTNNCDCSTIEGYKKCERPPECKKCGVSKFVIEKDHHFDSSFNGYENVVTSDFCLSLAGIKVKKTKSKVRSKKNKKTRKTNRKFNADKKLPKSRRKSFFAK